MVKIAIVFQLSMNSVVEIYTRELFPAQGDISLNRATSPLQHTHFVVKKEKGLSFVRTLVWPLTTRKPWASHMICVNLVCSSLKWQLQCLLRPS